MDKLSTVALQRMYRKSYPLVYRGAGIENAKRVGKYNIETTLFQDGLRMMFWSTDRLHCVDYVIDKEDNTASIQAFSYHNTCTVDGKMKHGKDTRDMINFSFKYAKKLGVTKVYLSDTSNIQCNGTSIGLAPMYFLKFGQTWYEKYFGFEPVVKNSKEYKEAKQKRLNLPYLHQLEQAPCDAFTYENTKEILKYLGIGTFHNYEWVKKL
jgi:hypothetical protein